MRINQGIRRAAWWTGLLAMLVMLAAEAKLYADSSDMTDPLLDLFVKKGYVTQAEAEEVKAEAESMRTNVTAYPMPEASQWKIGSVTKGVELFGDARLRYEDRTAIDSGDNRVELRRFRYAVRVGLRGDLSDDFYYGVRLDTGDNPRSSFVTFGSSTSGGAYQGPFGKSTAGINIGQVYLGWKPEDWMNLTIGKMPNPLYTTPLVWNPNISLEGAAERFNYTVGQANLFATLGQFIYADLNPSFSAPGLGVNGLIGQETGNIFMFAWQGGVNYHITTNMSAKIAATIYQYYGLQRSDINTIGTSGSPGSLAPFFGDPYIGEGAYYYDRANGTGSPGYAGYSAGTGGGAAGQNAFLPGYGSVGYPFNQVGLNDLLVLELPVEFDFKIERLKARVFGDFAYNLEGAQRAQAAAAAYSYILSQAPPEEHSAAHSFPAQTDDVKAYQIGFDIGSGDLDYGPTQGLVFGTESHKHDWEFRTYWQHIEQYALDPNILDTDFFEGRENMEGIYAALAYAVSDNVILTARYGYARRINSLLGTGGSGQDIPQMNPINHFSLLQVDATVRF